MADNNVVSLDGERFNSKEKSNEILIEQLEWVLERAKTGQIINCAVAYEEKDGTTGACCSRITASIIGAAARMQYSLTQSSMT